MIVYLIIFITGLIIGSFLNSVIYRLDELETIFKDRSHCPKCKTQLRWYDLIPLFSFVLLSGRCRYCDKTISWQYPIVELVTAILLTMIFWQFGISLTSIVYCLVSCFLIVIFVYDLKKMLIPAEMIWPAIIIALLFNAFISIYTHSWQNIFYSLLAAFIAAGFIALIVLLTRGKGMGAGDIEIAFLVGLLVSYPQIILALFLAFIIGSLVGIFLMLYYKKTLKSAVPFAPFLITGLYLTLFWGQNIINWYFKIS